MRQQYKGFRKVIGVLFAMAMVLGMVAGMKTEVLAAVTQTGTYTDDAGVTYNLYSDMGASVTGYSGTEATVTIPGTITATVNDEEKSYTVDQIAASAFEGNTTITAVTFKEPSNILVISQLAFKGCTALTSIDLSQTQIGSLNSSTFSGCENLEVVKLPNTLTNIGYSSFHECSALTTVSFPDGCQLTKILNGAFKNCTSLTTFVFPDTLESVGDNVFYGCSSLKNVTGTEGVFDWPTNVSFGDNVFLGCVGFTSVVWPEEKPASFGTHMFHSWSLSGTITIPAWMTEIPSGMFSHCSALTGVILHENVTGIGSYAFYNCTGLSEVELPDKVSEIGDAAFYGCTNLATIELSDQLTSIGNMTFKDCVGLSKIDLPDSLTSIGQQAFWGCSSLTSVVIPSKISQINTYTFYECSSLETVQLPSGLISIGKSAFYNCDKLEKIDIPDSVTSIEGGAFSSCDLLDGVILPDGLTELGNYAFAYCKSLSCITIPKNVSMIGSETFASCEALQVVTFQLPSSVTSIDERAFYQCTSLQSIEIPDNVTSIGINAFSGCTALSSVILPDSITEILDYAFYSCSQLSDVSLPASLQVLGFDAFNGCSKLTGIFEIPAGVTSISPRAFSNCNGIDAFIVPKGMTENAYGENCFGAYGMIIYPEGERLSIYDYQTVEITYVEIEDGTIALTLVRNGRDKGDGFISIYDEIPIPKNIYGKTIGAFNIVEDFDGYYPESILCTEHLLPSWDTIQLDTHSCSCLICSEEVSESHTFGDGTKQCECGYVPFTMTSNNSNAVLEAGYTQAPTLSVTTKATLGTETITYQWYENDIAISGANATSYAIPTGKAAGTYTYYCKVSCGDYCIKTDETEVVVYESETIGGIKLVNPEYVTPIVGDYLKDENNSGIYKVLTVTTADYTSTATIAYVKPIFDTAKEVVIPDTITVGGITYKVTTIDPVAFKGNKKITKVTIGNNVKSIPSNAFKGCTALTTVKMGTGVKTIGKNAFYGCKKLKNVTIGKNVTSIGDKSFYKCTALTKITLPSKLTKIGKSAFQSCTKLKTVTSKAKKLTKIGSKAFYGCKKLTKLTLKSTKLTKKSIGKNAFKKTNKKLVVKVPKSKVKKYKAYFKNKGNKTIKVKK